MEELQRGDPLENVSFRNIKYKNCKGGTLWKMQKRIFLKIIILNTRIAKGGPFGKKRIFLKITNISCSRSIPKFKKQKIEKCLKLKIAKKLKNEVFKIFDFPKSEKIPPLLCTDRKQGGNFLTELS